MPNFSLLQIFFWVKAISTGLFCGLDVSAQFFRDQLFVQSTCDHFVPAVHSSDVLLIVECRPVLGSSSSSSRPFMKCLRHSKFCILDITSLLYPSLRSLKYSVGVYFSFTKILKLTCHSILEPQTVSYQPTVQSANKHDEK